MSLVAYQKSISSMSAEYCMMPVSCTMDIIHRTLIVRHMYVDSPSLYVNGPPKLTSSLSVVHLVYVCSTPIVRQ